MFFVLGARAKLNIDAHIFSPLSFLILSFPFIGFLAAYHLSFLWNRIQLTLMQESEKNFLKRVPRDHKYTPAVWQENSKDFLRMQIF